MILRHVFLFLVVFCITSYGYSDYDVDGVEDSVDKCPNTPFDILVDESGCEEGKVFKGNLTFLLGAISGIDSDTETLTNMLFFINYRYADWDISLSSFNEIQNTISEVPDTFYLSVGHTFTFSENLTSKLSLGSKQSSLQDDIYVMGNIDYTLSEAQNLFLFYSYTFSGDSASESYDDFHTVSIGTGRVLTDYWYSALSYDYSGANLSYFEDYKALTWSNTVKISSQYYFLATYSYGLSEAASDHTISLQAGISFD